MTLRSTEPLWSPPPPHPPPPPPPHPPPPPPPPPPPLLALVAENVAMNLRCSCSNILPHAFVRSMVTTASYLRYFSTLMLSTSTLSRISPKHLMVLEMVWKQTAAGSESNSYPSKLDVRLHPGVREKANKGPLATTHRRRATINRPLLRYHGQALLSFVADARAKVQA